MAPAWATGSEIFARAGGDVENSNTRSNAHGVDQDWAKWGHHFLGHQRIIAERPYRTMRDTDPVVVAAGGAERHQTSWEVRKRAAYSTSSSTAAGANYAQ